MGLRSRIKRGTSTGPPRDSIGEASRRGDERLVRRTRRRQRPHSHTGSEQTAYVAMTAKKTSLRQRINYLDCILYCNCSD